MCLFVHSTKIYFNSHAHVERDTDNGDCFVDAGYFNSHAHVERDTPKKSLQSIAKNFNSHAHVERDL